MSAPATSTELAHREPDASWWTRLIVPLYKRSLATVTAPTLDEKELISRLAINSPELVQELLTTVQALIAAEVGRQTRLDSKATSLLTASGLSLTVITGFTGTLLTHPELVKKWPLWAIVAASFVFLTAVALGLIASLHAIASLRVRGDYRSAHEDAFFDRDLLQKANEPEGMSEESDEDRRVYGVMIYRKHLIPHYWSILSSHRAVHDTKSRLVESGQVFFFAFLFVMLVVCILAAVGVLSSA